MSLNANDIIPLWPVEGRHPNGEAMPFDIHRSQPIGIRPIMGRRQRNKVFDDVVKSFFAKYPHFHGYTGEVFGYEAELDSYIICVKTSTEYYREDTPDGLRYYFVNRWGLCLHTDSVQKYLLEVRSCHKRVRDILALPNPNNKDWVG